MPFDKTTINFTTHQRSNLKKMRSSALPGLVSMLILSSKLQIHSTKHVVRAIACVFMRTSPIVYDTSIVRIDNLANRLSDSSSN